MKLLSKLKNLYTNMVYLSEKPLKERETDISYDTILRIDERNNFQILNGNAALNVLDDEASWEAILKEPKSFIRIGDGELTLIEGYSIDFQKADARLADYLIRILQSTDPSYYVGVEYLYFHGYENITQEIRRHDYLYGGCFKRVLLKYANKDRLYINASFNAQYISHDDLNTTKYISNMQKLFSERDIVVFSGDGILEKLDYNLFGFARSVEYVACPGKNAFDVFDSLLNQARTYPKDKTLCFILGPTSKPLVYELSKEGYLAWDIGHMAKDYDACMKNSKKTDEFVIDFFAPD